MDQGKRDKGSQMADSPSLLWSIRFLPQYLASEFYLIIKNVTSIVFQNISYSWSVSKIYIKNLTEGNFNIFIVTIIIIYSSLTYKSLFYFK